VKKVVTFMCNECSKGFEVDQGCILNIMDLVDDGHYPDHCIYGKIENAKWEKQTTRY